MQSCIYALLDSEKCGNTDSKNWPWEDWTPQVRGWNNTCLLIDRIWTWALHLEPFEGGSSGNWCATLCFGTRLPAKEHRRLTISNACLLKCIRRDHGWLATNICAWTPQAERGFSSYIPRNGHLDEHRQFINYEPFDLFDVWRKVSSLGLCWKCLRYPTSLPQKFSYYPLKFFGMCGAAKPIEQS